MSTDTPSVSFDHNKPATWTKLGMDKYLRNKKGEISVGFIRAFFAWSRDEYEQAVEIISAALARYGLETSTESRASLSDASLKKRLALETHLINGSTVNTSLFRDRHLDNPQEWFDAKTLSSAGAEKADTHCTIQRLIGKIRTDNRQGEIKLEKGLLASNRNNRDDSASVSRRSSQTSTGLTEPMQKKYKLDEASVTSTNLFDIQQMRDYSGIAYSVISAVHDGDEEVLRLTEIDSAFLTKGELAARGLEALKERINRIYPEADGEVYYFNPAAKYGLSKIKNDDSLNVALHNLHRANVAHGLDQSGALPMFVAAARAVLDMLPKHARTCIEGDEATVNLKAKSPVQMPNQPLGPTPLPMPKFGDFPTSQPPTGPQFGGHIPPTMYGGHGAATLPPFGHYYGAFPGSYPGGFAGGFPGAPQYPAFPSAGLPPYGPSQSMPGTQFPNWDQIVNMPNVEPTQTSGLPDLTKQSGTEMPLDDAVGRDQGQTLPVDEPLASDPAPREPPADEPPADEPPADEPRADEPPADEPRADKTRADEPPADELRADEPRSNPDSSLAVGDYPLDLDSIAKRLTPRHTATVATSKDTSTSSPTKPRGDRPKAIKPRYPYMISKLPSALVNTDVREAPKLPSIDVTSVLKDVKVEKVEYLSSQRTSGVSDAPEAPQAAGGALTAAEAVSLYHIDPESWKKYCRFYGFDPAETHPRKGVFLPGWHKEQWLHAYQFYTSAWLLEGFYNGERFLTLAHNMGLGKTAIALSVMRVMQHNLSKPRLEDIENDGPTVDEPTFPALTEQNAHLNPRVLAQGEPIHQHGPMLIVAPTSVIEQWQTEIFKFIDNSRKSGAKRMVLVKCHGNKASAITARKPDSLFYHVDNILDAADMPSKAELAAAYPNGVPQPYTVREALKNKDDGVPQPWQINFVVFSTPITVAQPARFVHWEDPAIKQKSATQIGLPIEAAWSLVVFDEFHLFRNYNTTTWQSLAALPGRPQFLFLSGTPMTKLIHLLPPTLTAQHQFYQMRLKSLDKSGEKNLDEGWLYSNFAGTSRPKDFDAIVAREHSPDKEPLYERMEVGRFDVIRNAAMDVDSARKNTVPLSLRGEDDDSDDDDNAAADWTTLRPKDRRSFNLIKQAFTHRTISFPSELIWKPLPDKEGLPAVDIPPHLTYKLTLPIPEQFAAALRKRWMNMSKDEIRPDNKGFTPSVFFNSIQRYQIFALFPALPQWTMEDQDLADELGDFTRKFARQLTVMSYKSQIYQYMPAIDKFPAMQALRHLIATARRQPNWLKEFMRKIVIVSYIPMNVAIIEIYLTWLEKNDAFEELSDEADHCLVASWIKKDERQNMIVDFKTTKSRKTYQDRPFVMNASFSAVGTGTSLDPSDLLIAPDNNWVAANIKQQMARVSRAAMVQKAPFTEAFLLRPTSRECPVHNILEGRHLNSEQLQALIRASADFEEEEQNAEF